MTDTPNIDISTNKYRSSARHIIMVTEDSNETTYQFQRFLVAF